MKHYDANKVYLDIRNQDSMTEAEKQLLLLSELKDIAPIEIWTACGTNQQMAYSTHGVFRYFGKFPPPIATHLIGRYTTEGDTVFDPMCGSGTTGVEALWMKRRCFLNDVNPLSQLLAKVKTTFLPAPQLYEVKNSIDENYRPLSFEEYQFDPSYLRNYHHWFLDETISSLRGIKFLVEKIEDENIRDFYRICFASIVRRVSRATTQQGRLFLDVKTAQEDALPFFQKKVEKAIIGVSQLPMPSYPITVYSHDLREPLPDQLTEKADLIICHPPYFNSYKYSSINSLELAWLGYDYSQLRKTEVREFFKVGKEENSQRYVEDMVITLNNLSYSLKPNARIGLMIGDTIMHGNYISVTRQILDRISDCYDVELIALRAPKYTEAAWVASQRRQSDKVGITLYDFIIILRKK